MTESGYFKDTNSSKAGFFLYFPPSVMIEEPPISFSPFSLTDCILLSHFSFNDFIVIAFLDLAEDLDIQI